MRRTFTEARSLLTLRSIHLFESELTLDLFLALFDLILIYDFVFLISLICKFHLKMLNLLKNKSKFIL